MAASAQRYTAVAIVLHWAIAFAILLMIPLGFWMHITAEHGNVSESVFRAFQLHKSIGLTVLALSLVRLGWRLLNPSPPLPEHMPAWERVVAKALTGWLYVSTGWSVHDDAPLPVATHYFGLFTVPALFGLNQAGDETRSAAAEAAFTTHWVLAYAAIGLAVLHVLAALKHQVFDKDEVLAHMIPGLRAPFEREPPPKNPARLAVLGVGLSLTAVALAAALFAVSSYVSGANAPQNQSSFEVVETPNASAPGQTTSPTLATEPLSSTPSAAPTWRVDAGSSSIRYAFEFDDGEGAARIEGRFTRWQADIRFDPNNLENSAVSVTIDTGSADNGIPAHNELLPQAPWFNTAQYPTATFRASDFRRRGNGYEARGELTIKGRERNATLPFTLVINGDSADMNGQLTIDRRAYEIGEGTDADNMLSRDVEVSVRVRATRAP
jgi:cytochrome b561